MRFEELAYRDGGQAVTIPFHRTLTVLSGLDADVRRRFAERTVAALSGQAGAGSGVSLVFVDGSGSRVHLVRDLRGGTTVTDLDSGEDLAESLADAGARIDWLRLVGLASSELLLLSPMHFERDSARAQDPSTAAPPDNDELAEARAVLAQVEEEYQQVAGRHRRVEEVRTAVARLDDEIRLADDRAARRRFDDAARTVARLEAELGMLRGAEPAERRQAEAAVAAVRLASEYRAATQALQEAQDAFGDRRRLDHRALTRALGLPADMPADLERLQAEFLAATRRRAELVARLDAGAASDLPAPSAPWVITLARQPHPEELWDRAERATAARTRAAELSMGLGGSGRHGDLVAEIESVHQVVEEAERELADARIKPLAVAAKRRLAQAQEAEQAVLDRAGFVSWLAFQMRRIDVLLEPDAVEAMRVAELEHQVAAVAWAELAGDVDPEAALAARAEIECCAAQMTDAEHRVEATELLHRELAEDADPACDAARAALLEACRSFDVEPEHAVSEVAAIVSEARHARLQQTLEDAETAQRRIETELEAELTAAGRPGPGHLAERLDAVAGLASAAALQLEATQSKRSPEEVEADLGRARATVARLARPEWEHLPAPPAFPTLDSADADADGAEQETNPVARLTEERVRLLAEADEAGRGLPDIGRLADRREALARRVTILESSAGTGPLLVAAEEAEMVLLGRFAQTRRVGPEAEPVPVLVDDALAPFPRHEKWRLLDLLARLGEASQVVYLTDDEETLDWARSRAASGAVGLRVTDPEVAAAV